MAHFARIEDGQVREIVVIANDAVDGGVFPDSEKLGRELLAASGFTGEWVQCSYSGAFRGAYPGTGYAYDPATGFAKPEPAPGTVTLDADTVTALALTTKQKAVLAAATAPTEPDPVA